VRGGVAVGGEIEIGGDDEGLGEVWDGENEWQFAIKKISAHHLRMVSLSSLIL
jgi:hypothetical protein